MVGWTLRDCYGGPRRVEYDGAWLGNGKEWLQRMIIGGYYDLDFLSGVNFSNFSLLSVAQVLARYLETI